MNLNSIIINTYERPETLSRCLGALSRQKGIDATEIIIVDDGSVGDFKAVERLWKTKLNLRYLKIRRSGRSAARNRGLKEASGERVLFLGDDVMVRPGWLRAHLARGEGRRMLAVLGPYPLEPKERYTPAFRRYADSTRLEEIDTPDAVPFWRFVTGNVSMDRALCLELGAFDERFVKYGWEDIDLGYRFVKAGGEIVLEPAAKAIHEHPRMTRRQLWSREFQAGFTGYQFWTKWQNDDVREMKFWDDEGRAAGPEWRRRMGRAALAALERLSPNSALLPRLYERLVYSYRLLGVDAARRVEAGLAPRRRLFPKKRRG